MLALPGERYYAIPREILERCAVPKDDFDREVHDMWRRRDTIFHGADGQLSSPSSPLGLDWSRIADNIAQYLNQPQNTDWEHELPAVTGVRA